jgi:hypothetical protein
MGDEEGGTSLNLRKRRNTKRERLGTGSLDKSKGEGLTCVVQASIS